MFKREGKQRNAHKNVHVFSACERETATSEIDASMGGVCACLYGVCVCVSALRLVGQDCLATVNNCILKKPLILWSQKNN